MGFSFHQTPSFDAGFLFGSTDTSQGDAKPIFSIGSFGQTSISSSEFSFTFGSYRQGGHVSEPTEENKKVFFDDTQPFVGGFSFSSPKRSQIDEKHSATPLSFGSTASPARARFSFASTTSSEATGVSFGSTISSAGAGFSFASISSAGAGLSFGSTTTSAGTGFSFGSTQSCAEDGLSFVSTTSPPAAGLTFR